MKTQEPKDFLTGALPAALENRLWDGPGEWVALEPFVPLPRCLEWRLSRQYWDLHGATAFFAGEVPYACINDGRLSADTARLLTRLRKSSDPGPIRILEVGGGSGLFAKLFLDELRILSPALYEATTYFWTDGSSLMVRQADENQVFTSHAGKLRARQLFVPGIAALGEDAQAGFDLIIANYLVDNLPSTILRVSKQGLEELEVRATLRSDLEPRRLRGRTAAEWAERALATEGNDPELVELYPWFSLECRYRPVDRSTFLFESLIAPAADEAVTHWSHHELAWSWLKEILPLVRPGGGVLLNDYGHLPSEVQGVQMAGKHFGGSLANGVNLQELAALPKIEPNWQVCAPQTDSKQLTSRWLCRQQEELSPAAFRLIFEGARRDRALDLLERAREISKDGHTEMARWLFWRAHQLAPRCWHLLLRWGVFCLRALNDPQTAQMLAEQGLKLHPGHPPFWTLKGDALSKQRRFAEAEPCYRRALALSPREVLARLGLAAVHFEFGRDSEALVLLGQALALDAQGDHREALLDQQHQILLRIARGACDELAQQLNRFRNFDAPVPNASDGLPSDFLEPKTY